MMRVDAILREVLRDIRTGTARAVTLTLILSVLGIALVLTEIITVRGLLDEAERFRSAGGATLTITAPGRIDGAACEQLRAIDGVGAAGAVRERRTDLRAGALPDAPLATFETTPGFPALLAPESVAPVGLVVSEDVASELHLAVGDSIASDEGRADVAGVFAYPSDGRRAGFGWAALERVNADRPFDECWVSAWPVDARLPGLLSLSLLPADAESGDPPQIGQLNPSLGREFTGPDRFDRRLTAAAPLVAAGIGLLLSWGAVRLRRVEMASNLHGGVRRRDAVSIMLLEAAACALPPAVLSATAGMLASAGVVEPDRLGLILSSTRIAAALAIGVIGGTLVATLLVRERHLFRYFKDRA